MNYVDANILIYALVDDSFKGKACRKLLNSENLATSILSLDEVAYKVGKQSKDKAVDAVLLYSNTSNLILIPFERMDVGDFIEFQKKGLKPRDAIHALSARKAGCRVFYSEDTDFDKVGIQRKTPW